ncbi:MAG: flagellar biosynthesis protein FlhB [Tissierellia bacterium]|nr:flagellar biosynthesis protein FlhB [Tissierellia bacterium]
MDIKINLQLFADAEKTEKPTPKKRRDTREEGHVLQSKEISAAFILLSTFLGIKIFGRLIFDFIIDFILDVYKQIENVDQLFWEDNLMKNSLKIITFYIGTIAPILLVSLLSGLIINYLQVGFLFTTKPLGIKFNRINPIEGFKRIFSKRALVELVKSILKVILIGYVAYSFINKNMEEIVSLSKLDKNVMLSTFVSLLFGFSIRVIGMLIILALFDYLFQWREYEKNLMMTKEELKEEYKQTEGDPQIKAKIRERQRKIAMARMIQEVPKADVIITNPTHIAVALKYDRDLYDSPYVVAKGAGIIAENIKRIGEENSIPLVENRELAWALYNTVDIGDLIPEELYEAVAEVLAYVYSLKDNL